MSQPNVSYSQSNTSMSTHSQKEHKKKRKNPARRKDRCSFVYNSIYIIIYNTSRPYLNDLIIIIIFFSIDVYVLCSKFSC